MSREASARASAATFGRWAAALLVVWGVAAVWAVPPVIRQAYRGESLGMLNAMLSGRAVHPLSRYLDVWSALALRITIGLIVAAVATYALIRWRDPVTRFARRTLFAAPAVSPARGMLLAAGLGLAAGFGEFLSWRLRWLSDGEFVHGSNPDTLWIAPLLLACAFVLMYAPAGLVMAIAVRRPIPVRLIVAPLAFLGWVGVLRVTRLGIHPLAGGVMAAGLALVVTRGLARERIAAARWLRPAVLSAAGLFVLVAIGFTGSRWLRERYLLQRLPETAAGAPNVLFIILDTVRAESLSLLGYGRPTTPRLERIAERGVTFENAYAPSSWTLPSHATAFTGRQPYEHEADWHRPLDDRFPTVAEVLTAHGWASAGFVANLSYTTRASGLARGFAHYDDYIPTPAIVLDATWLTRRIGSWFVPSSVGGRRLARKNARQLNEAFLSWLDRNDGRPFFAFLNFFDAHDPYPTRPEFVERIGPAPAADGVLDGAGRWAPREPRLRNWLDRYDSSIAYVDHHLGLLFEQLDRRGLLDETLIVVTSDHGEQFGEHGLTNHGNSLYLPLLHVPLVIVPPAPLRAVYVPRRDARAVSLRDLPATILDVLGIDDGGVLPGRSLLATGGAVPDSSAASDVVVSALTPEEGEDPEGPMTPGEAVSIISGGLQYIRYGSGAEELYDLSRDRVQATNLAASPSRAAALRQMRERLEAVMAAPAGVLARGSRQP